MAWHRESWAGPALRAAGATALGGAWLIGSMLARAETGTDPMAPPALALLLALATFVFASAGSAMLAMGAHLFDPVEVPSPWLRAIRPRRPRTRPEDGTGRSV